MAGQELAKEAHGMRELVMALTIYNSQEKRALDLAWATG